jgi:glutamate formiminotransferase
MKILLAVPNISEGRNLDLIEQVAAEIRQTPGVKLIDYSSDPDHNRSVFTYLGPPEAVLAASKAMAVKSFELIDMSRHTGSHPRLGAVDVAPFIPIRHVEAAEAVELSRQFGRFVGELGVPVYYYRESATRPDRYDLPAIRKGQYEALPAKLNDLATWQPDEGPAVFNAKAGAMVTGCRFPLIAFNVNLHTTDLAIAKRIAEGIRFKNGGYRHVQAMGVDLKEQNMVQVSMNLTNYVETPLPRVLETVRMEAARHGVTVAGTEIIGSIPLGAVEEIIKHYVQAHDFKLNQILETALLE